MPTPTIDPMAYEAAYQAVRSYEWNKTFSGVIVCAILWFIIWILKE